MENTILIQGYLFLVYLISGILIGVIFDIFRVLRRTFKTSDFITYIQDVIFWILTGILLLYVLLKFSSGEIRIYNFIAILIGFIVYMLTISKYFMKINVIILKFLKKIVCEIIRIILVPIKFILKLLRKIFSPFTFFVINIKNGILNFKKKEKKEKKEMKNKIKNRKIILKRRIFKNDVEK